VEFGLVEDVAQELVQLPHFGLRRDRFQRRLACARSNTMHSATVVLSIERDRELKKKVGTLGGVGDAVLVELDAKDALVLLLLLLLCDLLLDRLALHARLRGTRS
jgi:hypothetical protein